MTSTFIIRVVSTSSACLMGWIGGIYYERKKVLPGPSVFAANVPSQPGSLVPVEPHPNAGRTTEIMRFGFPSYDTIRSFDDFVLSYDKRNRTAHWVFEHLTHEGLKRRDLVDRAKCQFSEDTSIHPFFRATNEDYKRSGFDRGHLAAAGNHRKNQQHCDQTFLLSNISPQVGQGFNRDAWNRLEKYTRHLTKSYKNVYVCTGPLYLPRREGDGKLYVKYQVIGTNLVAVPTHFFKVIVGETYARELDLEAYVMPNAVIDENIPLHNFHFPIESIERASGFLLFDKIPRTAFKSINGFKSTFV